MSTDDKAAGTPQPRSLRNLPRRAGALRVYLAGSSAEMRRARTAVEALAAIPGVEVVSTWLDVVEQVGNANPRDATVEQRREWVAADLDQVAGCDLIWFLVPSTHAPTRGAWGELCYAHALNKLIVCSGDTKQSIFCALGEECSNDDCAIALITEIEKVRAA